MGNTIYRVIFAIRSTSPSILVDCVSIPASSLKKPCISQDILSPLPLFSSTSPDAPSFSTFEGQRLAFRALKNILVGRQIWRKLESSILAPLCLGGFSRRRGMDPSPLRPKDSKPVSCPGTPGGASSAVTGHPLGVLSSRRWENPRGAKRRQEASACLHSSLFDSRCQEQFRAYRRAGGASQKPASRAEGRNSRRKKL